MQFEKLSAILSADCEGLRPHEFDLLTSPWAAAKESVRKGRGLVLRPSSGFRIAACGGLRTSAPAVLLVQIDTDQLCSLRIATVFVLAPHSVGAAFSSIARRSAHQCPHSTYMETAAGILISSIRMKNRLALQHARSTGSHSKLRLSQLLTSSCTSKPAGCQESQTEASTRGAPSVSARLLTLRATDPPPSHLRYVRLCATRLLHLLSPKSSAYRVLWRERGESRDGFKQRIPPCLVGDMAPGSG